MENVDQEDSKKLNAESQANSKSSGTSAKNQEMDSEEDHYGHTRQSVDKMLARAIKRRFTDVLDSVFFFSNAEIKTITINKDHLQLIVYIPFVLPAPSPEGGLWWDTVAAQIELRRDFAKHLRSSTFNKTFARLFHTELSHFLLERGNIGRYREEIQKLLRKLPQQELAGRPSRPIGKAVANEIKTEGVKIYQALQNMQMAITGWKDNNPKLDNPAIKKKLSRRYPLKTYPWRPFFYELIPKLPCKPYLPSKIEATKVLDEDGHPLPAKLSEPDRWSTKDIATKIMQAKLLQERGIKFPLRGIRQVLAKARPQVNN
jgi:hypothetical protein